jgi:hypothetical protein
VIVGARCDGASIQVADVRAFVHDSSGLIAQFDVTSNNYFTTLGSNNTGTFGWTFANAGGTTLHDVRFFAFLDADIDREVNTFFNEYGEFISLSPPPGSPPLAIAASSWEINEPGFLFGDILNNLLSGTLANSNSVPSSAPDDVALALGFSVGTVAAGQTITGILQVSLSEIGGLHQIDTASDYRFYVNGYAQVTETTADVVPEPATLGLTAFALVVLSRGRRRTRRHE